MATNSNSKIIKYILLKIYTCTWMIGEKIPSKKALSIRFDVSPSVIFNILNVFKESGLIESSPQKGYYVSRNKESFFFYSLNEFKKNDYVETFLDVNFELNDKLKSSVITADPNFEEITDNYKSVERKYKMSKNNQSQLFKKLFILIHKDIYDKFDLMDQLKEVPLYKFLALNGYVVTKIRRMWLFSTYKNKRYWTNVEMLYDIENNPLFINVVYYYDTNDEVLSFRSEKILASI